MVFSSFYAVRTTKINLTLSSAWHCQLGAVSSTLITTSNNASLPCEECARRAQCLSIYRRGTSMYYHSCTVASNQQSGLFPFPSRIADGKKKKTPLCWILPWCERMLASCTYILRTYSNTYKNASWNAKKSPCQTILSPLLSTSAKNKQNTTPTPGTHKKKQTPHLLQVPRILLSLLP